MLCFIKAVAEVCTFPEEAIENEPVGGVRHGGNDRVAEGRYVAVREVDKIKSFVPRKRCFQQWPTGGVCRVDEQREQACPEEDRVGRQRGEREEERTFWKGKKIVTQ